MTRLDWLVVALLAVLLTFYVGSGATPILDRGTTARRPLPPAAEAPVEPQPERVRRPPLAPPSPRDPTAVMGGERPAGPTVGTAFPVDERGTWMTARHVIAGCKRVGLFRRDQRPTLASVPFAHETADLALLHAEPGARPLQFVERPISVEEEAFALGYPKGALGAAHFLLLGRARLQHSGWMGGASPVLVWADAQRFPEELDTLGGMSGGPVLDDEGRVVGIVVAGSPRRGRQLSLAPEVLDEVRRARFPGAAAASRPVIEVRQGPGRLREMVDSAARGLRIALVLCGQ